MKRNVALIPLLALGLGLSTLAFMSDTHQVKLLADDEINYIALGDRVSVESRKLSYGDEEKIVQGQIINPRGAAFEGREFTATEHGKYQVVYRAYFNHHVEEKIVTYLCQRRGVDYFEVDSQTTISFGEYRYNTDRYSHQGVIFDVKNGSSISFKEPIDMKDYMTPQPDPIEEGKDYTDPIAAKTANALLDFLVDPTTLMSKDFAGINFRFTDTEDKNNYFEIRLEDPGYSDTLAGALTYARAGASNNFLAGWEYGWGGHEGHYHYTNSGTGIAVSLIGQAYQEKIHSGQFLFDYANKRLYTYPGSLTHDIAFFMNDLDNPELYKSSVWKGFTKDKCYLTITQYNFSNTQGRIILKAVGKIDLTKEIIVDETAPTIEIDYHGNDPLNLPKAVKNRYYPIFDAKANDDLDSDLDVDAYVTFKDTSNNETDVTVEDGKFFVSKDGTYIINYQSKDRSGNASEIKKLVIPTIDSVDNIKITLPSTEKTVEAYDSVHIPSIDELTTTGGNGHLELSRVIYDPKGNIIEIDNNTLNPKIVGKYTVNYQAIDYIGTIKTASYQIDATALAKPKIIGSINLPPVLINGFTYQVDNVSAIEAINNEIVSVTPSITVNGQPYNGSFKASSSSVNVTYTVNGQSGTVNKSIDIPVVDTYSSQYTLNQAAYFYGDMDVRMNEDDVTLSANTNSSVIFANKLDASNFYLMMERENNNYEKVVIKLTDASDSSVTLTCEIDPHNQTIVFPGMPEVAFNRYLEEFSLGYNNKTKSIIDTVDKEIGTVFIDDNGNAFNGFNHGVYLTISFAGVSGPSSIKVLKLDNQSMGYKDGTGDRIDPIIAFNGEHLSEQEFGEDLNYPTFEVFDVLSEIETTQIRVLDPNLEAIGSGDKDFNDPINIDQYGSYSAAYLARDTAYNTTRVTLIIYVYDDVAPTLTVDKLKQETYSVGQVVEIPKYKASDNISNVQVDVLLLMPTNELRILTHEENGVITYALTDTSIYNPSFINNNHSFKTEMKGRHKLRYVAYDEEFNETIVELVFYVK